MARTVTRMKFKLQIPDGINLYKTLECGQIFRFADAKLTEFDPELGKQNCSRRSVYRVISGEHAAVVVQYNNEPEITVIATEGGEWSGSLQKYWANFFNTDRSMRTASWCTIKATRNERLYNMCQWGDGIRILNQEPWEALLCFLVSQRNSIPRIKDCVEKIATQFGTAHSWLGVVEDGGSKTWHSLPKPEDIVRHRREDAIGILRDKCKVGYRAEYIYDTAAALCVKTQQDVRSSSVEQLLWRVEFQVRNKMVSSDDLVKWLQQFKGVGPKVAECAALFGFGCCDRFPVDVWIQRALDLLGPDFDPKSLGMSAGLVQQYLYYYMVRR